MNLQASIMMGNYEFYYAAGLAYKLTGNMATEILQPQQLIEEVNRMLADYMTDDVREQHLIRMFEVTGGQIARNRINFDH